MEYDQTDFPIIGATMQLMGGTLRVLQPVLHVLRALAMQLPVGVLKHVVSSDVHGHVLFPQALIQPLQLLAEVSARRERERERY